MRYITFFLFISFFTISIFGLGVPKQSKYDTRMQAINYNEADVVEINTRTGVSTLIEFGQEEEILDIASGFSAGWQFGPRHNYLFIMPKTIKEGNGVTQVPIAAKWDTNVQVTTNKHVYVFQLVLHQDAVNETEKEKIAYLIKFTYPLEEKQKARLAQQERVTQKRLELTLETPRNNHYSMRVAKNSQNIAPSMAYDDGRFTYLQFPGNNEFPAIFEVASDRTESLVNSHIDPKRPDVLVVHTVAKEFALRSGKAAVGVINENYDPKGIPAVGGTVVPGIEREVRDNIEVIKDV